MERFEEKLADFYEQFGESKIMVLATSLHDKVTSRMMSMIVLDGQFYFQTDTNSRKYQQLQENPHVSLCIDNIQIEGVCKELESPLKNQQFCMLYKKYFKSSYDTYSSLQSEKLFVIKPTDMQLWIYEDGKPLIEKYDFINEVYEKKTQILE